MSDRWMIAFLSCNLFGVAMHLATTNAHWITWVNMLGCVALGMAIEECQRESI